MINKLMFKVSLPLVAVSMLAACGGGASVCEKPKLYQQSELGKRIEVPEGLDPLQAGREMSIPEVSPRDPAPAGSPCLEMPPVYGTGEQG